MRPLKTTPPDGHPCHGSMTAPRGLVDALAQIDWTWLAGGFLLAACCMVGVGRLRRRGDRWPSVGR